MKISFRKSLICLLLAFICTSNFPINIKAEDNSSFDISTAEDLIALANNCRVDSYSKDKTFNIIADIDLNGKDFKGIPVFDGKLNGNNHVIRNMHIKSSNIEIGFIGTLLTNGVVDSLTIEGDLVADGIVRGIGGIAAANLGTITNCTFNGTIDNVSYIPGNEAEQVTGGIASKNYKGALVSLCKAYGRVVGVKNTGGIVGVNEGQIMGCVNYASVNKNARDRGGSVFKDLKIKKLKDIQNLLSFSKLYSCENTGGIAGYSIGDIYSSENKGTIGKSSNGYNVGGIVGKSSGYIEECKNTGEVFGNSNVGGICGQLEPGVIVKYTDNLVKKAKGDVDELFNIVDDTLDKSTVSISNVSYNVNSLFANINKVAKCASEIETIASDIADVKFNEVGQFKDVLFDAVHTLSKGIETIGSDATKMTKDVSDGVNSILNIGEDISSILFPGSIERKKVEYTVRIKNPQCIDYIYQDNQGHYSGNVGNTHLNLYRNGKLYNYAKLDLNAIQENNVTLNELEDGSWVVTFLVDNISETSEPNYYYPEINDGTFLEMEGVTTPKNISMMYTREVSPGYDCCFEFFSHYGTSGNREAPKKTVEININWDFADKEASSVMPDRFMIYVVDGPLVGKRVIHNNGTPSTSAKIEYVQDLNNIDEVIVAKPYDDDINSSEMGGYPEDKLSKFESECVKNNDGTYTLNIKYTGGKSWGSELLFKLLLTAGAVTGDIAKALESFKSATTSLTDISAHLTETMDKFNNESIPAIKRIQIFKGISGDLDGKIDEFSNYVVAVSNSLNGINQSLNNAQSSIINGIKSVVEQANTMTDTVFETIYDAKDYISSILADESKEISSGDYMDVYCGVIESCVNYGDIDGDTYIGGVAGSMSLSGIPLITQTQKEVEFGLPSISYRALIKNAISDATIKANDGYAGLICGNQDFGAIVSCSSNGVVKNKGNYTGGVVGFTHGLISNCTFKGELSGKDYIGGIAGATSVKDFLVSESTITNNYSNLKLKDHNKFIGAIAGNYAGSFKDNYYYCDETEGVNTYALEGEYEPRAVNYINNKVNIESNRCFVRYIASGNVVEEIETSKGSSIPSAIVPCVPKLPGLIGFWLDGDILNVNKNQTIRAIYIPHPIIIAFIVVLIILIIVVVKKTKKKNIKY